MKTDLSRRLYLISDVVSLTGASRSFINDLRKRNFVQVAAGKKHNMKFDTICPASDGTGISRRLG